MPTQPRHLVRYAVALTAALTVAVLAPAHADEARKTGTIVFVAGGAQVDGVAARVGDTVADGDLLRTEHDGYLYIRTAGQGVVVVHPGTQARFVPGAAGSFSEPGRAVLAGAVAGRADDGAALADRDARKSAALQAQLPVLAAVASARPAQAVSWGRWDAVLGQAPGANLNASEAGARRVASNDGYAVYRSAQGEPYVTPARGKAGFALAGAEASVRDTVTQQRSAATLSNGQLQVDFNTASFSTRFDVRDQSATYQLASHGSMGRDGQFSSAAGATPANNMQVQGALSGNGAVYLFDSVLTPRRVISGVTLWRAANVR